MRKRAFITHKKAESYTDCQDRFAIGNNKIALSDGMTSGTLYPDVWAMQLVNAYIYQDDKTLPELIPDCQKKWAEEVNKIFNKRKEVGESTWRLENMINSKISACATFCGLKYDSEKWEGVVVGDSAIVELKDSKIENIFITGQLPPDNYPDYLDSIKNNIGVDKIKEISGQIRNNTILLLVSDPFTDFLFRNKDDNNIIERILKLETHKEFIALVDEFRNQGMHNDDSTIVIIEFNKEGEDVIDNIDDLKIEKLVEDKQEEKQPVINTEECIKIKESKCPYFSRDQIGYILKLIEEKLKIPKKFKCKIIKFFKEKLNCGKNTTDN